MKRIINLIICLAGTTVPLYAQPVLSLDDILKRIDTGNVLLQSYEYKARSYEYSAEAATAWMAPMAGAGTFMYPYSKPMDERDKGSIMIRLEQEIPNRSRQRATKDYILSKGAVDLAERTISRNDLKATARSLYYDWIVAVRKISILERNESIMQTMKKIEEVRYPYNQSLLGNVFRVDAKIEDNRNMVRMLQGEISRSRAYLNSLMNTPGNMDFQIDTTYIPVFAPVLSDTAELAAIRGDISQMDASLRSMNLNIAAMKLERKPAFKLSYDHMTPRSAMMPNAFSVMAMVSIPIAPWSSKMYRNEVRAMQFSIEAMQKERSAMLLESQGMLVGMQYEIKTMQARITAMAEKILPSLRKAFDVNYIAYQENKLSLASLLGDWEALIMMEMNIADEEAKLYKMIVSYEKELYK